MICDKCGYDNVPDAKFCGGCGGPVGNNAAPAANVASMASAASAAGTTGAVAQEAGKLGPYELRDELGRGAMARVWRAWDPNLGREVAIKEPLFDPRLGNDVLDEMGRRFVREAKTAARLNHPGIVTIYAADVYAGRPAIVMEIVKGATLAKILEHGPLAPTQALNVLEQLLDAVGYAHSKGIVHRDIKPDNIFIDENNRVKLADFGIARADDAAATHATVAGAVLGTPGYMSPEQARGSAVDARSDLFSIGVVGYEMLSGRNPFGAGDGADSTTLLYRIVHEPAPWLPDGTVAGLPVDVRPAIMAALEKDPANRPQSAQAFTAMLKGLSSIPAASASGQPTMRATMPTAAAAYQAPGGSWPATYQAAGGLPSAAGQQPTQGNARRLAPFIIIAAVLLAVVIGLFVSANAGGGGGAAGGGTTSAPGVAGVNTTSSGTAAASTSTSDASSTRSASSASSAEGAANAQDASAADTSSATSATTQKQEAKPKGATPPVFTTFAASSVTSIDDIDPYGPEVTADGNPQTAWNTDGQAVGDPIGQWIELSATDLQRVSRISILNGFCKNETVYAKNRRPHDITVSFSDGSSFTTELKDVYGTYQEITLPDPVDTTYVRITINSTYAPTYNGRIYDDCAISEIDVG